jgi:hypothetical protein
MNIDKFSFKNGIPNEYKVLFSTRFVTNTILNYIMKNTHSISQIITPEYSIKTFHLDNTNLESEIYDIENRVKKFISLTQPVREQLPLRIFWFPTQFKKMIPIDKNSLDVNEINSACTIHYGNIPDSLIVIYRLEEAKKVLFHELVHLFSLDVNIPPSLELKIRTNFNLNHKLPCSLAETYAEFMGCLLNIYYISNGDKEKFNRYLAIEQAFSLYQVNKILNFFKIDNINDLYKLTSDTNLMTYYFLKTAIIIDENVNNLFYSLIQNKLLLDDNHLPIFEKYLNNLLNLPKYLKYIKKEKLDDKTMRMTIVE